MEIVRRNRPTDRSSHVRPIVNFNFARFRSYVCNLRSVSASRRSTMENKKTNFAFTSTIVKWRSEEQKYSCWFTQSRFCARCDWGEDVHEAAGCKMHMTLFRFSLTRLTWRIIALVFYTIRYDRNFSIISYLLGINYFVNFNY